MEKVLSAKFMQEVSAKLKVSTDKIRIENPAFRVFSKATVAILFLSCGFVTVQELIGKVTPDPVESILVEWD